MANGRRLKVLFVCHNHPALYPGGSEQYAVELYEEMRLRDDVDAFLVARVGPTASWPAYSHPGTPFSALEPEDPNQYLVYSDAKDFDRFLLTLTDKNLHTRAFPELLDALAPDIVHFQHTHYLGYDLIRTVRNTLPGAGILYTLHEYWPICHRDGQLLRAGTDSLCPGESPRRCNQCFPDISAGAFFMRKQFIQSHLSEVDLFLAPSRFLRERYVAWGIPEERIRFNENGRRLLGQRAEAGPEGPRNRLAYFGQFAPHKGVTVLLEAMNLLARTRGAQLSDSDAKALDGAHLWLHGGNLEWRSQAYQEEFRDLVADGSDRITLSGSYAPDELPLLMRDVDWVIVPSIWYENAPLTIQEAFHHGRPVICSGVGGMAEKVTDGVNGLHCRVGDPVSLADTITRAVTSEHLWNDLRSGIPEVRSIEDDADGLIDAYREVLMRAQAVPA
jgi:glycosyltransferase involved in cell wall biosynthesis